MTADKPLFDRRDLTLALGLLTRLPVEINAETAVDRGGRAAWAWPLVGAGVGLAAAGILGLGLIFGLSPGLAATAGLATLALITGALHEDGLADTADGLWGGATRTRRLEIMADSRLGSYGAVATVLALLARWSALTDLAGGGAVVAAVGLVSAAMSARGAMAALMAALPSARPGGLAASTGRPPVATAAAALALAALAVWLVAGGAGLSAMAAALAASAGIGWLACRKLGGQTGDVLGAGEQVAEIAALCVLSVALT